MVAQGTNATPTQWHAWRRTPPHVEPAQGASDVGPLLPQGRGERSVFERCDVATSGDVHGQCCVDTRERRVLHDGVVGPAQIVEVVRVQDQSLLWAHRDYGLRRFSF